MITIVDDGRRGAITVCGSGFAGIADATEAILDELCPRGEAELVSNSR